MKKRRKSSVRKNSSSEEAEPSHSLLFALLFALLSIQSFYNGLIRAFLLSLRSSSFFGLSGLVLSNTGPFLFN